jgi:hypothetical protein
MDGDDDDVDKTTPTSKCIVNRPIACTNDAVKYGLCIKHLKLPPEEHIPTEAGRIDRDRNRYIASMAGSFFSNIAFGPGKFKEPREEKRYCHRI